MAEETRATTAPAAEPTAPSEGHSSTVPDPVSATGRRPGRPREGGRKYFRGRKSASFAWRKSRASTTRTFACSPQFVARERERSFAPPDGVCTPHPAPALQRDQAGAQHCAAA